MTPRDQAIEEARTTVYALVRAESNCDVDAEKDCRECSAIAETITRAAIEAYESARARLDGAKMMPREATPATPFEIFCPQCREMIHSEAEACAHGLLPRATPKEGT